MKSSFTLSCLFPLLLIGAEAFGKGVVVPLGSGFYIFKITCNDFQTVESATERIWMDRNLGACRVARSIDDAEAYGDLYQWGRLRDGHEKRGSGTITSRSTSNDPGHSDFITGYTDWLSTPNNLLWQGVSGTNSPCPAGFRLPTEAEWQEEINQYGSSWDGLFNSPLRLPAAGYRNSSDGAISGGDSFGNYWSGSVNSSQAWYLYFAQHFGGAGLGSDDRADGLSVRCIKE